MPYNFNLIQLGAYVYCVRKYLSLGHYEAVLRVLAALDSLLESLDSTLPPLSDVPQCSREVYDCILERGDL